MSWAKRLASVFLGGVLEPGSRGKGARPPRGHRVVVEPLEDRRLLSVNRMEHPFDSNMRFAADINADGAFDFVEYDTDEGQYVWQEFNSTVEHPIGNALLLRSVADLNGDEFSDFLALLDSNRCVWYENDGSGQFTEHVIGDCQSVHSLADTNGDGFLDIIVTFNDNAFGWYENDGSGNFAARRIAVPFDDSAQLRAADMNHDGHIDFLSGHGTITLHLNDGDNSFNAQTVATAHVVSDVYDFDSDGDLDILLESDRSWGDERTSLSWYENDGGGFTEHVISSELGVIGRCQLADLNGDRHVDIVGHVYTNWSSTLLSYTNNGQGGFSRGTIWSGGTTYDYEDRLSTRSFLMSPFLVTDVTNDGYPDIVMSWGKEWYTDGIMESERNAVDWFENDAAGGFHRNELIALTAEWHNSMNAADFDGDGDVDILVSGTTLDVQENTSAWYENLSSVRFREIPSVDLSTNEFRDGFTTSRKGLVTTDATFTPTAGTVTLRLLDNQGQLIEEVTGTDGYLRIDHIAPAAGTAYELQVAGTNTNVDLRICNLVSQTGNTVDVFDTEGDDTFRFSYSGRFDVTANGVEYHFDDASDFSFHSTSGQDMIELVGSDADGTLTASPMQMTIEGTLPGELAYSATADGFYAAHGYAVGAAQFVGSEQTDRVKSYPGIVKLIGSDYFRRVKGFGSVSVDTLGGTDMARVALSKSPDVVWAKKNELRVAYDEGLENDEKPPLERVDYDVNVVGVEFVVARTERANNDWLELHDSALNDVFIAKPHKVEMMNAPRVADGVARGDEYRIVARGFRNIAAIADQGGDGDVAKLYDTGEDGVDLWAAGYLDGQTWSTMSSPWRVLYEVLAFEHVGGYGFNGALGEEHGINRKEHADDVDFVFQYGYWEGDVEPEPTNPRNPRGR